ncbi:hypothetical protein FACS189432_05570 [Bacteroidia bacterium]|nr:hypothetical protein FACS189426_21060 [Bacteroidia bacterium]GHT28095.1 hypothetical protein FACS189432_05570 [Bacteroidia bacterium]
MIYDFKDLQQTAENRWQARYEGNYGTYTVKIEFDQNGRRKNFSCTCPSDGYPCKHIGYLQEEIKAQSKKNEEKQKKNELTVEDILQNVSLEELRAFVVKKAKFNNDLTKAITLEFAEKLKKSNSKTVGNIYKPLMEADLRDIEFDLEDEDNYYNECAEVDVSILGEWFDKAEAFVNQQKYDDALQVCKAVIEEYAEWYEAADGDTRDYVANDFQDDFFDLLKKMAENEQIDKQSLYEYCKQEQVKEKYFSDARDLFNDLMSKLANSVNPEDFIAAQKGLLKQIADKSSYEAAKIVRRLYDFYLSDNQNDKADEIVEQNTQIESFCKLAVEKRIAEKRYDEAKNLIFKFLETHTNTGTKDWNEYLLKIAQKENDVPTIRKIAFEFIEQNFDKKHFAIYKSAFSADEWNSEFEKLYSHYDKQGKSWFNSYNSNVPDLLVAENLTEQLIEYINSHLTAEIMEHYYSNFAEKYPEKTLKMFRNAVDFYAEKNVGEKYYGYVCNLLKLIRKIRGGDTLVLQMIENYRIAYKRRTKMMELLNKL